MGPRGKDAKPLSKRTLTPTRCNPWDIPGLSRSERVIAFCEDLTVTMTAQNREFVLGSAPANSRSVPAMAGATRAGVGLRAGELANAQRPKISSQP
jgi:hypothetical protein